LKIASLGADFLRRFGRDEDGDWYFCLRRDGLPLVAAYNIFSDCFAVLAFCEYASVSGESWAMDLALDTYWKIQSRKDNPKGRFTKQIAENRPIQAMALPMIQIDMGHELNRHHPDPRVEQNIEENLHRILSLHVDEERRTVYERVYPDGSHPDCMEGRLLSPGHACEVLWFILAIAVERGDRSLINRIADSLLWTIRRGWDDEYGGIFYYLDSEGFPPEKLEWDMKLWWVNVESLYAFLLAYSCTERQELLDWFFKIHDYSWEHFDDPEYGEWFGYLNRRGEVSLSLKGGKWKGFFHLPRALLLSADLLGKLAASGDDGGD
jgi:N-acylglucosamine 2-epimerase